MRVIFFIVCDQRTMILLIESANGFAEKTRANTSSSISGNTVTQGGILPRKGAQNITYILLL